MNSLSWFLYLAGLVENVGVTCGIFLVLGGLVYAGWFIAHYGMEEVEKAPPAWLGRALIAAVFVGVLAPSKNTMYAIAASEAGERLVASNTGQEVLSDAQKALQQWIKRQIEPESKK